MRATTVVFLIAVFLLAVLVAFGCTDSGSSQTAKDDTAAINSTHKVLAASTFDTGVEIRLLQSPAFKQVQVDGADEVSLQTVEFSTTKSQSDKFLTKPFQISGISKHKQVPVEIMIPKALMPKNPKHVPFFSWYDAERKIWRPIGLTHIIFSQDQTITFKALAEPQKIYAVRNVINRVDEVQITLPSGDSGTVSFRVEVPTNNDDTEIMAQILDVDENPIGDPVEITLLAQSISFSIADSGKYTLEVYEDDLIYDDELWFQDFQIGGAENHSNYDSLAETYAPIYSFHNQEQYSPLKVDADYFTTVKVVSLPGTSDQWIGGSSNPDPLEFLASHGHREALLNGGIGDTTWALPISPPQGQEITVYWLAQKPNTSPYTFITYWMFFRRDEKVDPILPLSGNHDRDRESVTIVFDDENPIAMIYYGHVPGQILNQTHDSYGNLLDPVPNWNAENGLTLSWADVDKDDNCQHPIVYVARGTHAQYPRKGWYELYLGGILGHIEFAGGDKIHCNEDGSRSGISCTMNPLYNLERFPVNSMLSHSNTTGKQFSFSGFWVDGLGSENSKYPPFTGRYEAARSWSIAQEYHYPERFPSSLPAVCGDSCENECSSGEVECTGASQYHVCGYYDSDECLEWGEVQACPSGQSCQGGQCVVGCSDDCDYSGQTGCADSTHTQTCGQYDSDSCLDWGSPVGCSSGEVCENGQCTEGCTGDCAYDGQRECTTSTSYHACHYEDDGCLYWQRGFYCPEGQICSGGYCVEDQSCPDGNGYYCGEGVDLTTGTLYYCSNGNFTVSQVCEFGCTQNPPGTNDVCTGSGNDTYGVLYSPADNATVSGTFGVTGNVTDQDGLVRVTLAFTWGESGNTNIVQCDGNCGTSYAVSDMIDPSTFDPPLADGGTLTIGLWARDQYGEGDESARDSLHVIWHETSQPDLEVTTPGSSTIWQTGQQPTIRWTSQSSLGNVMIRLRKGSSYVATIASSTADDGSYSSWTIPDSLDEGSDYRVRIHYLDDETVYDNSDYFSIEENTSPSITVSEPDSSDAWDPGDYHYIRWDSTNSLGNVKIRLYKGGSSVETITSSTSDDGSYRWRVSSDLDEGSDYRIKVYFTDNSSIYDYSDYFTINEGSDCGDDVCDPDESCATCPGDCGICVELSPGEITSPANGSSVSNVEFAIDWVGGYDNYGNSTHTALYCRENSSEWDLKAGFGYIPPYTYHPQTPGATITCKVRTRLTSDYDTWVDSASRTWYVSSDYSAIVVTSITLRQDPLPNGCEDLFFDATFRNNGNQEGTWNARGFLHPFGADENHPDALETWWSQNVWLQPGESISKEFRINLSEPLPLQTGYQEVTVFVEDEYNNYFGQTSRLTVDALSYDDQIPDVDYFVIFGWEGTPVEVLPGRVHRIVMGAKDNYALDRFELFWRMDSGEWQPITPNQQPYEGCSENHATDADWLVPDDLGAGITLSLMARAYDKAGNMDQRFLEVLTRSNAEPSVTFIKPQGGEIYIKSTNADRRCADVSFSYIEGVEISSIRVGWTNADHTIWESGDTIYQNELPEDRYIETCISTWGPGDNLQVKVVIEDANGQEHDFFSNTVEIAFPEPESPWEQVVVDSSQRLLPRPENGYQPSMYYNTMQVSGSTLTVMRKDERHWSSTEEITLRKLFFNADTFELSSEATVLPATTDSWHGGDQSIRFLKADPASEHFFMTYSETISECANEFEDLCDYQFYYRGVNSQSLTGPLSVTQYNDVIFWDSPMLRGFVLSPSGSKLLFVSASQTDQGIYHTKLFKLNGSTWSYVSEIPRSIRSFFNADGKIWNVNFTDAGSGNTNVELISINETTGQVSDVSTIFTYPEGEYWSSHLATDTSSNQTYLYLNCYNLMKYRVYKYSSGSMQLLHSGEYDNQWRGHTLTATYSGTLFAGNGHLAFSPDFYWGDGSSRVVLLFDESNDIVTENAIVVPNDTTIGETNASVDENGRFIWIVDYCSYNLESRLCFQRTRENPVICHDNNPCTEDIWNPDTGTCSYETVVCDPIATDNFCTQPQICDSDSGGCVPDPMFESPCPDDGLACNGVEICIEGSGQCGVIDAPEIDDGIACTIDECNDENGSVTHTPDTSACLPDHCHTALCDPSDVLADEDTGCVFTEIDPESDGLSCTQDICDPQTGSTSHELIEGYCLIDDACVAEDAPRPGYPCQACNPDQDAYAWSPVNEGGSCDDGLHCNGTELCASGQCLSSGNPCPVDESFCNGEEYCDEDSDSCETRNVPVCADNGQYCNGEEFCDDSIGECSHRNAPCPDDQVFCNGVEVCEEATDECVHRLPPECPDDTLFCNGEEFCDEDNKQCGHRNAPDCPDDGLWCTGEEFCDEDSDECSRRNSPECPDDSLFCNGSELCDEDNDQCAHSGDPCEDGAVCLNHCNEDSDDCLAPDDYNCDDNNLCNGVSTCQSQACVQTADPIVCESLDICHLAGVCDPASGECSNSAKEDGTFCDNDETGSERCYDGVCVAVGEGDVCDLAITLSEGNEETFTNIGFINTFTADSPCSETPLAGPDIFFQAMLEPGEYMITLKPEASADLAIVLLDSCNPTSCTYSLDEAGVGGQESYGPFEIQDSRDAQPILIAVDSVSDAFAGEFQILIEEYIQADGDMDDEIDDDDDPPVDGDLDADADSDLDMEDTPVDGDDPVEDGDIPVLDGDEEPNPTDGDAPTTDGDWPTVDGDSTGDPGPSGAAGGGGCNSNGGGSAILIVLGLLAVLLLRRRIGIVGV